MSPKLMKSLLLILRKEKASRIISKNRNRSEKRSKTIGIKRYFKHTVLAINLIKTKISLLLIRLKISRVKFLQLSFLVYREELI